jgi:uncharacterized protein YecT (DUF1311 family)
MVRIGFLAAILLGFSVMSQPATAQTCAGQTDAALKSCLGQHYADVDRLMADAYKQALVTADGSGRGKNLIMDWKRALQEAQRKWIAFREADCGPPIAYETTVDGQREIDQLRCRIGHTEARFAALAARYRR